MNDFQGAPVAIGDTIITMTHGGYGLLEATIIEISTDNYFKREECKIQSKDGWIPDIPWRSEQQIILDKGLTARDIVAIMDSEGE